MTSTQQSRDRNAVFSPAVPWLLGFLAFTLFGLLEFGYRYLDDLARNHEGTFGIRLLEESTGAYSAALLFPLVVWFTRRFPLQIARWYRVIPLHLIAMIVFALAHTSAMALSRIVLSPLFGLGPYDYGLMRFRYWMESMSQISGYWTWVIGITVFDHYRATRNRQVAVAELETRLAESRLENLRLQLHPHFLFNSLNTISSVMYEDVERADAMLARLSDLLRRTLGRTTAREVSLGEELSLIELYLDMMRARFGDALQVRFTIDETARAALVPQLLLQPLVENALQHGADRGTGNVQIEILAMRTNDELLLEVRDRGPGIERDASHNVGLTNIAETLRTLYGEGERLTLANRTDGGLTVTIRLPFRIAGERA